jgi:MFS family permease
MLWAALHVSKTIFSIIGGYISDKVGRKIMISFGWLFYSITYFGFAFAYESWHIWALFIFYGLFFGFTEGVEKAFVGDLVPAENRGLAYGFYNLSIGIAALPASLIFGFIWNRIGFKTAFITGAILSFVSVILLIFVKNTKKTTENTN